jgi:4-hydroxybenzoate polyprenyltransferase
LQHGVVIAAFAFATLAIASAHGDGGDSLRARSFALGFAIAFLCFLELRILDEFKDASDDARYRPYRPVPRGLVTLQELRAVGVAAVAAQAALAACAGRVTVALLAVALGYMALMGREFFAPAWLRARPLVYLVSHTVIVPLIALAVAACAGRAPDIVALVPFLALTYASSAVFEFGRKIRAPTDERVGVETYSALWGPRIATGVWWATLAASALLAVMTATAFHAAWSIAALGVATLVGAGVLGGRFLRRPATGSAKSLQAVSGLWLVAAYLALGMVALHANR